MVLMAINVNFCSELIVFRSSLTARWYVDDILQPVVYHSSTNTEVKPSL